MIEVYTPNSEGEITDYSDANLTSDFVNVFAVKNTQYKRLPAYVKEYSKFNKLCLYFSNYIYQAIGIVEQILNSLNIKNLSGDILKKVMTRFGIDIYTDKTDPGEVNAVLQDRLRLIGIKRKSLATLADYEETIRAVADIIDFEIVDLSCVAPGTAEGYPTIMAAVFRAVTGTPYIVKYDVERYLNPNVTGLHKGISCFQYGGNVFTWNMSSKGKDSNNPVGNPPLQTDVGYYSEGWGPAIAEAPESNEGEPAGYPYTEPGEWR